MAGAAESGAVTTSAVTVGARTGQASFERLSAARLLRAKASYTTRHVARWIGSDPVGFGISSGPEVCPRPGDVVLARVEEIGQHARIELPGGRRALLYPGDEVLVAYGHRYAPDQFEAEVPPTLGPVQLVAAGGLAGQVLSQHAKMLEATTLCPVGLLAHEGAVVRLQHCAPLRVPAQASLPAAAEAAPVIGVLGTSMNSGKSTTVGAVVRGLTAAGLEVAAGKVTGTGAGGDAWLFGDSGATQVLDFTDFGFASTYKLPPQTVRGLLVGLVAALRRSAPDVIVLEVADGIFQRETARLINDPVFTGVVDTVLFAAADAIGAHAGVGLLAQRGVDVCGVSGLLTASPLATREAQAAVGVPVLLSEELAQGHTASELFAGLLAGQQSGNLAGRS